MRFGVREDVLLVVRHVNPFVHQYRISTTTTTYAEAAIPEFAKSLGLPVTVPPPPTATVAVTGGGAAMGGAAAVVPAARCGLSTTGATLDEANVQAAALTQQRAAVKGRGDRLERAFADVRSLRAMRGSAASARADSLRNPSLADTVLVMRLGVVLDSARAYAEAISSRASALEDSVGGYVESLASMSTRAASLADKYPACATFAEVRTWAASATADTGAYRGAATRATAHATALRTLVGTLERVQQAMPEATRLQRSLGLYDDPTRVDLVIQRSPVGVDTVWRTIATPRLTFGGRRRFSIGVGATAMRLAVADYAVVRRYPAVGAAPPAGQPADTVERVIVETTRSTQQVAPLLSLNARLAEIPTRFLSGVHLTVGTAPRSADSKLTLDYLIGASLSAADERILLGAGIASAEEQTIGGGYTVGARVPAEQETVPLRRRRVERFAVSLSFRVF